MPKIEIVGESELYVKAGTTVSLKCVITQALEEPAYIFWYHNDERVLNYDKSLVEIRMERVAPDTTVRTSIVPYHLHSSFVFVRSSSIFLITTWSVGGESDNLQSTAWGFRQLLVFAV